MMISGGAVILLVLLNILLMVGVLPFTPMIVGALNIGCLLAPAYGLYRLTPR